MFTQIFFIWIITAKKRAEVSQGLVSTTVILWSLSTILNAKRTESFKLSLSDHHSQAGKGALNNKWGRKNWNTFEIDPYLCIQIAHENNTTTSNSSPTDWKHTQEPKQIY